MSSPYEALEKIFHEPNRLSIVSTLCSSSEGRTFSELKNICDLTDGNLSRHLSALENAGVVQIEKKFVGAKPQTTVFLSEKGKESFLEYLGALEEVFKKAMKAAKPVKKKQLISKVQFPKLLRGS